MHNRQEEEPTMGQRIQTKGKNNVQTVNKGKKKARQEGMSHMYTR